MRIVNVTAYDAAVSILWDLLDERTPLQSISHERMPSWEDHCAFVHHHPYDYWYLILDGDNPVGSIYLTENSEIGISIFERYTGKGFGTAAVRLLMERHKRESYLANVNPLNIPSQNFWRKLNGEVIQWTYKMHR